MCVVGKILKHLFRQTFYEKAADRWQTPLKNKQRCVWTTIFTSVTSRSICFINKAKQRRHFHSFIFQPIIIQMAKFEPPTSSLGWSRAALFNLMRKQWPFWQQNPEACMLSSSYWQPLHNYLGSWQRYPVVIFFLNIDTDGVPGGELFRLGLWFRQENSPSSTSVKCRTLGKLAVTQQSTDENVDGGGMQT